MQSPTLRDMPSFDENDSDGVTIEEWRAMSDEDRMEYQRLRRRDAAFRTKLCNLYKPETGCPWGPQCRFAHGEQELNPPPMLHPKYKTELCRNFTGSGTCRYGARCQFVHAMPSPRPEFGQSTPQPLPVCHVKTLLAICAVVIGLLICVFGVAAASTDDDFDNCFYTPGIGVGDFTLGTTHTLTCPIPEGWRPRVDPSNPSCMGTGGFTIDPISQTYSITGTSNCSAPGLKPTEFGKRLIKEINGIISVHGKVRFGLIRRFLMSFLFQPVN